MIENLLKCLFIYTYVYLALPSFKHVHRIWYKLIPSSFNWFIGLSRDISTVTFLDYSYTNPHKKPALASKRKIMLNTFLLCFWLPQIFFRMICLKMLFSFRLTIAYNAYHTMYLWILCYIIILIMLIITPQKRTATNNISSSGDGKKYIVC